MATLGITPPKSESNVLRNSSLDDKKRAQVVAALDSAQKFLRTYGRPGDYFTGMSLGDLVALRLEEIGTPPSATQTTAGKVDTAFNRLTQFSEQVLEAIKSARTIDAATLLDTASEQEE